MSERSNAKLIAILAVFLAAAGGAAYWFFGVRAKNDQKKAAQNEILAWETRLVAARECLFGQTPASSDSGEALSVRELTPDPWDRKSCTKTVGAIARGVAEDTGIMPVEHAWMTLDRAAAKVATAFAVSKDPYGKTAADERRGVSDLPDALRELDKAHAELRQAAGLPPATNAAKLPQLPVAQIIPLLDNGAEVTGIDTFPRSSAGSLLLWGATKDGSVQLALVPGATPKIQRVPANTMRSITPDANWAVAGLGGGIELSTVDERGTFKAPITLSSLGGSVLAAVGPLENSGVAFATAEGVVFAHGKPSPRGPAETPVEFTRDKPVSAGVVQIALDPVRGRALVAWELLGKMFDESEPREVHGVIFSDGAPTQTVAIGAGSLRQACLTSQHAFAEVDNDLVRFDATGPKPMPVDAKWGLSGCGTNGALLSDGGTTTQYMACTDSCRLVDLRGSRPTNVATLAGDHVVAVAVRERVLAVWSEKGNATFYRLPEKVVVRKAISDGKTLDIVAESATENKPLHYVLVRVPAP